MSNTLLRAENLTLHPLFAVINTTAQGVLTLSQLMLFTHLYDEIVIGNYNLDTDYN